MIRCPTLFALHSSIAGTTFACAVCVCTAVISAAFNNLVENCGANGDNWENSTNAGASAVPSGGAPENDDPRADATAGEAGGTRAGTFYFVVLYVVHVNYLQTNGIALNGILNTVNADEVQVLLDIERRHQIAAERFEKARQIAEELGHAAEQQGMLFVGHASFLASWLAALETVASKELPIIERYEAEKALKRRRGLRKEGVEGRGGVWFGVTSGARNGKQFSGTA